MNTTTSFEWMEKMMDNMWIFITLIIVAIVILYFVFNSYLKKFLRSRFLKGEGLQENGFKTVGFIKSYEQTGTYLNEQPKIRFTVDVLSEQHEIVSKTFTEYVQLTDLHQLRTGMPVPLVYDRQNPNKMAFDPYPDKEKLQDLIDLYQSKQPDSSMSYEERVMLRKKGVDALALVKNIVLTGRNSNEKVEATITVEITTESQNKIEASRTLLLTKDQLKSIQIGQVIDIKYLPGNEEKFYFNFAFNEESMMANNA